jgi:hypothetical protein
MNKDTARALASSASVAQGVELVTAVGATAAEAMRARRDPAVVAGKKVRAARRRAQAWTAGAIVSGAVAATGTVTVIEEGLEAGAVGAMIFLVALFLWCVVGVVRAVVDLRARKKVLAALPAAAPQRPVVAGEIRPEMARLDGYSDGLRHLVGMIGIVEQDPGVRALRDEILDAADTSEARLRKQAMDLTGLLRARRSAPPAARVQLDGTVEVLRAQIHDGVAGYGELVSAASEAVAASRQLADQAGRPSTAPSAVGPLGPGTLHPELEQPIDQLRSLAAGMRELTQG